MSVAINVFFQQNINLALKPHWEAVLLDPEGKPLEWTRPLIFNINAPRLSFDVSPADGGAFKAYAGYKMPDALSLKMYETTNHDVEQYLEKWMFGPQGVFDKEKGVFRRKGSVDNLSENYRQVKFMSTAWRVTPEDWQAMQSIDAMNTAYSAKEIIVTTTTYTCAIESYTIDSYDYSDGGAVSYSVELPVVHYTTTFHNSAANPRF
jgi:hypothetical protein